MTKFTFGNFEAYRLDLKRGDTEYVYDSRGYEHVEDRYGKCVFFGGYDDCDDKFFSFWYADCYDPPQYLICARSWEEAYDIYLDEFAPIPDDEDIEGLIDDLLIELIVACVKEGSIAKFEESTKEWLVDLMARDADEYNRFRDRASEKLGEDGQVTWAPNGARVGTTGKWNHLRWSEGIHGVELQLVRAHFAA